MNDNNNNLFKYLFAVVVFFLIGYTLYIIFQNKSNVSEIELDQTSTLTNIQTELRFGIAQLDTLNPIFSNNRDVQEITKIIYDPLVTLNENFKLEYKLAEEIAKTDGNTYVVKLRKGVLWQDKSNFNAYDVKFTIDLIKECETRGMYCIYTSNLAHVVNINIVDDYTIQIGLDQEIPFFEYYLTFPIMSQNYYANEDFFANTKLPIGTGIFKIQNVSSNMIELEPNEIYWDVSRKPMATKININLYSTNGEMYQSFKNGEIDILSVNISNIEDYIGSLGYKKIEYKSRIYDFLTINTQNELLSDPQIRKAISLVIDKNNIVGNCLGKGYVSSNFSLDMGNWLYTKDLNIPTDTDQATMLLNNAGWELSRNVWQRKVDGKTQVLEISLLVNADNQTKVAVCEDIKNQLELFGIRVNIQYESTDSYQDRVNNKNYDIVLMEIQLSYTPNLNTFFGNGNLANYYNDEVNNIMNIINNTSEENQLYDSYSRIYDIYLEEAPYIGLYRNTEIVICNQNLVGNISANSYNIYHNIEKWYRQ